MELLLQLILEPLFFAYYDLVDCFIGDKQLKKWQEYLLKILCLVISLISFFLVLIGSFWITDTEPFNKYGLIFLIVGGSILLVHILIGLFVGVNHFVEEKREEDFLDYEKFSYQFKQKQTSKLGKCGNFRFNRISCIANGRLLLYGCNFCFYDFAWYEPKICD